MPAFTRLRRALAPPMQARQVARYDRPGYLPGDLAVIGTHADNEDLGDGPHFTVAEPRDRHGLLLRVRELAGLPRSVTLRSPYGGATRAVLCHADEREPRDLPVRDGRFVLDLRPWEVVTVKLKP